MSTRFRRWGCFRSTCGCTPIDFLAADGHKWLLGPEGAGLFYVRREHLDLLRPVGLGWNSVRQGNDYTRIELHVKPSAARYEGGSYNMAGLLGLARACGCSAVIQPTPLLLGCSRSPTTLASVSRAGAKVCSHREPERASGIVAFELPGRDSLAAKKQLLIKHIVVSCRAGRLRISPHAYTNDEDLDRLIAGLSSIE